MFPRLRQRISTAVLDRVDLVVELSTLGEYGLGEDGLPIAAEPAGAISSPVRSRDICPWRGQISPQRCDASARS
jgi:hypothetical protein